MTSPLADSSGPPPGGPDEPLAGLRAAVGEAVSELAAAGDGAAIARADARAAQARGVRRLLDERRAAARAAARRAPARGRRASRRGRSRGASAPTSSATTSPARGSSTSSCPTDWCRRALARALGPRFGAGGAGAAGGAERILVEFVSANPTGPMHVGHARNAAYGDALARMLAFHGHSVAREFYINDAGSQIVKFGESIAALARGRSRARGRLPRRLRRRPGRGAARRRDARRRRGRARGGGA